MGRGPLKKTERRAGKGGPRGSGKIGNNGRSAIEKKNLHFVQEEGGETGLNGRVKDTSREGKKGQWVSGELPLRGGKGNLLPQMKEKRDRRSKNRKPEINTNRKKKGGGEISLGEKKKKKRRIWSVHGGGEASLEKKKVKKAKDNLEPKGRGFPKNVPLTDRAKKEFGEKILRGRNRGEKRKQSEFRKKGDL